MIKKSLSVLMLMLAFTCVKAQDKSEFKPSGKIIARGFVNVNSQLKDSKGVAFGVSRAYLGYKYKFSPNLQVTVIEDFAAGKTKDGKFAPALKNVCLQWSKNKLTLKGGLMGLYQFKAQESYWGYRYIYKSFQDHYKMGHSADVGLYAKYKIIPQLAVDFALTNGEGYKKIRRDKSMRYQFGVSVAPVKQLLIRLYADMYNDSKSVHEKNLPTYDIFENQYTFNAFIGYKNDFVKIGAEYNMQNNAGLVKDNNLFGYSAYCTANLNKKWKAFARFDLLQSSANGNSWNKKDGKVAIIGTEYKPYNKVVISPNFRYHYNDLNKEDNYEVYLSLEFKI